MTQLKPLAINQLSKEQVGLPNEDYFDNVHIISVNLHNKKMHMYV